MSNNPKEGNSQNPDFVQLRGIDPTKINKSNISTSESVKFSQEQTQIRQSDQMRLSHLRQSQNSSAKQKSSRQKKSPYLVINTRQGNTEAQKDRIVQQHEEIFETNEKGEIRRVKFESPTLRYKPKELFSNVPTFHEPVINFEQVTTNQIDQIENIKGTNKEITDRDKQAMNNYACVNQDAVASESPSNWKIMHEMLTQGGLNLTKQIQHKHNEDLRSPALPFMAYPRDVLKEKIRRSKEYKKSHKGEAGYMFDYSKFEQKPKKMEKGKRGGTKNKNFKPSPRESLTSGKKLQNRQAETFSGSSGSNDHLPRPKSNIDNGFQLPSYFKSHIQREKTNHSAIRMQKMLQAMNIDPQQLGKSNRGKSQEQKNREQERIQKRIDKKLERFNERNVVSTGRRFETEVECTITPRGTTISNTVTQRTFDQAGMSTIQTDRGQICMTGSVNGAFYCQKHPQQLVNYHYMKLLQEHEQNQRLKAQGINPSKTEVASPKNNDIISDLEAKYKGPKYNPINPQDTLSTQRRKQVSQRSTKSTKPSQGFKGKKNLKLDNMKNTEDSMFSQGQQDISEGPATFRNNSVEWTGRISPQNKPNQDLESSRNFNFQGGLTTGFAQTDQNKNDIEIVNEQQVDQHILDHIKSDADSLDEKEVNEIKQEIQLTEEVEKAKPIVNDNQDYVESKQKPPEMIQCGRNSRSSSKKSQRIKRRQSEQSSKNLEHEEADMEVQLATAPINPSDLRVQEQDHTPESIQYQQQEVLFAGKNPFGEFSQTIDVLKRESQSRQADDLTMPSPGLSHNPSSNIEQNSKVLVKKYMTRNRGVQNANTPNTITQNENINNLLSGGTSTYDENSYIQIKEDDFIFKNKQRIVSQPTSGLSEYQINNGAVTSKGNSPIIYQRPGTQQQTSYMGRRNKRMNLGIGNYQFVSNPISSKNQSPKTNKQDSPTKFPHKKEWDNRVTTAPNQNRSFSLQKLRRNIHTRARIQAIAEQPVNGDFSTIFVGSGIPITADGSNEELHSRNQKIKKQYFSQTIDVANNQEKEIQNNRNKKVLSEQSKERLHEKSNNANSNQIKGKEYNRWAKKNTVTGEKLPSLFEVKGKSKTFKPLLVKIEKAKVPAASAARRISFVLDEDGVLSDEPSQRPKTVMNESSTRSPKYPSRNIIDENKKRLKHSNSRSPAKKKETMSSLVKRYEDCKRISDQEKRNQLDKQGFGTMASFMSDYSSINSTQKNSIKSGGRTLTQITNKKFKIKPRITESSITATPQH